MNTIKCQLCRKEFEPGQVMNADLIEDPIVEMIKEKYPDWSSESFICIPDLYLIRRRYVTEILKTARQEIVALKKEIDKEEHVKEQVMSRDINEEFDSNLTLGDRYADRVANFGGSWKFIGIFLAMMVIWMGVNSFVLIREPFDPYPYILLNLVLSCLAAVQAPVIMMSQNRQEARDRLRAEHDFEINLKAEIEIRKLHERLDHHLMHQWQHLMDFQQLQLNLMEEINQRSINNKVLLAG
jgi:uncharacterized membrane protein